MPYQTPFVPFHQGKVSAGSSAWAVSLKSYEKCNNCPSGMRYVFAARDLRTGATSDFQIASLIDQIDAIYLPPGVDRVAILGREGSMLSAVFVVGLPGGRTLDTFSAVWPSASPDHRFIAYRKWFPAHPPAQVSVSDEYLLYDLTKSPAFNRPNGAAGLRDDVGWPVYPQGAKNASPLENLVPRGTPAHSMASNGFFWLGEETLAFVDRWHGVDSLVLIGLKGGIHKPTARSIPLDVSQVIDMSLCRKDVSPSDMERWTEHPGNLIYVTCIQRPPKVKTHLRLRLAPGPCLRSLVLDLPFMGDP
ncbi:MAG: hypothetical protein ACRD11_14545 [Terriglobia bacterium]